MAVFCAWVSLQVLLLLRFPARSLGVTIIGEIFVWPMWSCFNPTIEVVTFRLRGWCMLGVLFLLLTFTRLGHEHQDLLSPCDGMHVCTEQTSVYTLIRKSFGGMESEPMLTPREKSPLPEKLSPEKDRTHDAASSRTVSPTYYQRAIPAPVCNSTC